MSNYMLEDIEIGELGTVKIVARDSLGKQVTVWSHYEEFEKVFDTIQERRNTDEYS